MKITYETQTNIYGKDLILRYVDGELDAFIPIDPANSDYQRYLNPEAEQSTPIVAAE
jgi:hypothetical protein